MKKATLSRILGLALALVLALSTSVAFAMPSGTSAIEGLPEMPTVPTMTTAAKGDDVTITLSEKLGWLNVIQNWNWNDIIKWSDDGLTGTYSTKDMGTQPGYGSWNNNNVGHWDNFQEAWIEEAGPYVEDEIEFWRSADDADTTNYVWEYDYVSDESRKIGGDVYREYPYGAGYYINIPTEIKRFEYIDEEGETQSYYDYKYTEDYIPSEEDTDLELNLWEKVWAAQAALVERYEKLGDETAAEYCANIGWVSYCPDGIVRTYYRAWKQTFGNYRLKTGGAKGEAISDFAYDGETVDGTHVKYGRYGECLQIAVTLTGVNFLGTDKTPVKTTVNWCPLEHKGKNVSNWYIYEITEEYEDGSKLSAHFSSSMGGKYLGSKAE